MENDSYYQTEYEPSNQQRPIYDVQQPQYDYDQYYNQYVQNPYEQQQFQQNDYPEDEDQGYNFDLNKFDPSVLTPNQKFLFLGATKRGKSMLLADIMHHLEPQIRAVSVSSKSEKNNHFYEQDLNIPPEFINHEFDANKILPRLFFRQEAWAEKAPPGFKKEDMNCLLIADDCLDDKQVWMNKLVNQLFYMGRHGEVGIALLAQYFIDIPRNIRTQFDYIFVLAETYPKIKHALFEFFFGMFSDFHVFNAYFEEYTSNYKVLVINNRELSNDLKKKLTWYKADVELVKKKLTYPNSTMHIFHELHYKPKSADSAPINWNTTLDVSSLPEVEMGQYQKGKKNSAAINFFSKSKPALQYRFTLRDSQGNPIN